MLRSIRSASATAIRLQPLATIASRWKGGGATSSGSKAGAKSGGSKAGAPPPNGNRSNQMNPNNASYWTGHGWGSRPQNFPNHTPQTGNNRADQMNPNNPKSDSSAGSGGTKK